MSQKILLHQTYEQICFPSSRICNISENDARRPTPTHFGAEMCHRCLHVLENTQSARLYLPTVAPQSASKTGWGNYIDPIPLRPAKVKT